MYKQIALGVRTKALPEKPALKARLPVTQPPTMLLGRLKMGGGSASRFLEEGSDEGRDKKGQRHWHFRLTNQHLEGAAFSTLMHKPGDHWF